MENNILFRKIVSYTVIFSIQAQSSIATAMTIYHVPSVVNVSVKNGGILNVDYSSTSFPPQLAPITVRSGGTLNLLNVSGALKGSLTVDD